MLLSSLATAQQQHKSNILEVQRSISQRIALVWLWGWRYGEGGLSLQKAFGREAQRPLGTATYCPKGLSSVVMGVRETLRTAS